MLKKCEYLITCWQWPRFFTAEKGSGDATSEGGPSIRHEVDLVAPLLGVMQHAFIPIELQ